MNISDSVCKDLKAKAPSILQFWHEYSECIQPNTLLLFATVILILIILLIKVACWYYSIILVVCWCYSFSSFFFCETLAVMPPFGQTNQLAHTKFTRFKRNWLCAYCMCVLCWWNVHLTHCAHTLFSKYTLGF